MRDCSVYKEEYSTKGIYNKGMEECSGESKARRRGNSRRRPEQLEYVLNF